MTIKSSVIDGIGRLDILNFRGLQDLITSKTTPEYFTVIRITFTSKKNTKNSYFSNTPPATEEGGYNRFQRFRQKKFMQNKKIYKLYFLK